MEARAYAGLGHAARCAGDYAQAKHWHERQLDMALATRDKVAEGRACSNLGIVYQLLGILFLFLSYYPSEFLVWLTFNFFVIVI